MADWQGTNPDELITPDPSVGMSTPFRKKAMREELRRRMAERSGESSPVVRKITAYLRDRPQVRVVALFAPLPGEVNLLALPEDIERIWAFPKVGDGTLVFHQVKDAEKQLESGAFGILEPVGGLPAVDVCGIDLFLCPGLGFDINGGRIGRGKGFYDGILANARPDALKLGVCFAHQIVDKVVMEDHDIRMDGVIAG